MDDTARFRVYLGDPHHGARRALLAIWVADHGPPPPPAEDPWGAIDPHAQINYSAWRDETLPLPSIPDNPPAIRRRIRLRRPTLTRGRA